MNNDISADVKKYNNAGSIPKAKIMPEIQSVTLQEGKTNDSSKMEKAMNYLGAMGHVKFRMDNPLSENVKTSVESFNKDPLLAQSHVDICDELVKRGYPLEIAVTKTDEIIDALSNENTYK